MARSFRRWPRCLPWLAVACGLPALVAASRWWESRAATSPGIATTRLADQPLAEGDCEILQVLSGETVVVGQDDRGDPSDNTRRIYRVRLLGIRVPAAVAEPARVRLSELCAAGEASIDLDKRRATNTGEALAWLHVGGNLVAEQLVREGLAQFESYPGDDLSLAKSLREAQDEARDAKCGCWADSAEPYSGAGKSRL